jgi:mannose-6-phosphate isomerase-like protein (cupin superfamily)
VSTVDIATIAVGASAFVLSAAQWWRSAMDARTHLLLADKEAVTFAAVAMTTRERRTKVGVETVRALVGAAVLESSDRARLFVYGALDKLAKDPRSWRLVQDEVLRHVEVFDRYSEAIDDASFQKRMTQLQAALPALGIPDHVTTKDLRSSKGDRRPATKGPTSVREFETKQLPAKVDDVAPDGSDVRILLSLSTGGMAHFALGPRKVSVAIRHRTISEIWYVTEGLGQMWRKGPDGSEEVVDMRAGTALTIPVGTAFQFRCTGGDTLNVIGMTAPPWPGAGETEFIEGRWQPTVEAGRA